MQKARLFLHPNVHPNPLHKRFCGTLMTRFYSCLFSQETAVINHTATVVLLRRRASCWLCLRWSVKTRGTGYISAHKHNTNTQLFQAYELKSEPTNDKHTSITSISFNFKHLKIACSTEACASLLFLHGSGAPFLSIKFCGKTCDQK